MRQLREVLRDQLYARVQGLTPSGSRETYATQGPGWTRNTASLLPYDKITGLSPNRACLITPDCCISSTHGTYNPVVGDIHNYVSASNVVYQRTVTLTEGIGFDITVARYDSALPAAIDPMPLVPVTVLPRDDAMLYAVNVTNLLDQQFITLSHDQGRMNVKNNVIEPPPFDDFSAQAYINGGGSYGFSSDRQTLFIVDGEVGLYKQGHAAETIATYAALITNAITKLGGDTGITYLDFSTIAWR